MTAAVKSAWQLLELRRRHYDVAIVANGAESHRAIKRALAVRAKVRFSCSAKWFVLTDDPVARFQSPLTCG